MKTIIILSFFFLLSSCLIPESADVEAGDSNLPLFVDEGLIAPLKESCLCGANGSAVNINQGKVLFLNDQSLMDELEGEFGFHKLMSAMKPANLSFDQFVRSYTDGYGLSAIPSGKAVPGEVNDLRARNFSKNEIVNNWPQSGGQFQASGSPYQLIALLFRPELIENDASGNLLHAGEFRFIYKFHPASQSQASLGDKKNHIILEYKLPLEPATLQGQAIGSFKRIHWLRFVSKLHCLNGDDFKNHLRNVLRRVAIADYPTSKWRNGSALGQLRVNDFLNPNTPASANPVGQDWSLFEYRLGSSGKLERHRMPLTPKDNFSNDFSAEIKNQGLVNPGPTELINFFTSNFSFIKDDSKDYNLPSKLEAWQNDYVRNTSWGTLLNNNASISALSPAAERSFAKYRFSLNTCNGCHGGTFRSNQNMIPNLGTTAAALGKPSIDFSNINSTINFLHVNKDGLPTIFLLEDLQNRKEELEFQLSVADCMEN